MGSRGGLLIFGSVLAMLCAFAGHSYAVTFSGPLTTSLGTLSWPNPHKYKNFIASGEYCTSTHFTCERPDFDIQTASLTDSTEYGDLPLADPVAKRKYFTKSSQRQGGGTGSDNSGGISSTSNPGDSPTGTINGGQFSPTTVPLNPSIVIDPPPPFLPPPVSPIPLPNTLWLLLAAVFGFGLFHRYTSQIGNLNKLR